MNTIFTILVIFIITYIIYNILKSLHKIDKINRNDSKYTSIKVCPDTQKHLSEGEHAYSDGVCPHCGHVEKGTFTHYERIVGKFINGEFVAKDEIGTIK